MKTPNGHVLQVAYDYYLDAKFKKFEIFFKKSAIEPY